MRSLDKKLIWIQQLNTGLEIANSVKTEILGRIQAKGYQTTIQAQIAETPTQTYALIDTKFADLDFGLGDLLQYKNDTFQIIGIRKIENAKGSKVLYTKLTLAPSSVLPDEDDQDFDF